MLYKLWMTGQEHSALPDWFPGNGSLKTECTHIQYNTLSVFTD